MGASYLSSSVAFVAFARTTLEFQTETNKLLDKDNMHAS